jgi:UDP-N-acetylmuramyl pentapeptide synthase
MMLWNTKEIAEALLDELKNSINNSENLSIENVFIDSRKKVHAGLFIALKGENTDGHKYLSQAFENGANFAIVEEIPEQEHRPRVAWGSAPCTRGRAVVAGARRVRFCGQFGCRDDGSGAGSVFRGARGATEHAGHAVRHGQ